MVRQFKGEAGSLRALNAAFLLALCRGPHPSGSRARKLLRQALRVPKTGAMARFYLDLIKEIEQELSSGRATDGLSFPAGPGARNNRQKAIRSIRKRRTVRIVKPCKDPLTDPARELLFTANFLVTAPVGAPRGATQDFYFDHPVPLFSAPAANELLHGLAKLNDSLAFEKAHGKMAEDARADCVVSISPTHRSLVPAAKRWALQELGKAPPLPHLRVFLFDEADVRWIVRRLFPSQLKVFGVTGEYGRHYSFLKAVAALWRVVMEPDLKATFKIDLDQAFLEKELVRKTGRTLFDRFRSPLWGALGRDSDGNPVELGMIAGKLVTPRQPARSLFKSDVPYPTGPVTGEAALFNGPLLMALSTEAETAFRYGAPGLPDGVRRALQRVHVTGGINGIRIDSLLRHRPFTPSFMGRAEDQAYLLGSLYSGRPPFLRCVHAEGVAMRHDKLAAAEKPTAASRKVGDLIRHLDFSGLARALPWGPEKTKAFADPFTGAFISQLPKTVAALRLGLSVAAAFQKGHADMALDLFQNGRERLPRVLRRLARGGAFYRNALARERRGWNLYYDTLGLLQKRLARKDPSAVKRVCLTKKYLLKRCVVPVRP